MISFNVYHHEQYTEVWFLKNTIEKQQKKRLNNLNDMRVKMK